MFKRSTRLQVVGSTATSYVSFLLDDEQQRTCIVGLATRLGPSPAPRSSAAYVHK